MNQKKKIISSIWLILFSICLVAVVSAQNSGVNTYGINEKIDLSAHVSDYLGDISGANCSIEIQNSSFSVLQFDQMQEVRNGWYNYSYNTSQKGYYYCKQNCTFSDQYVAGTCDFVVEEQDTMAFGMIIFIPLFIAGFLLLVSYMLDPERYWALKLGLILLGFIFIFQSFKFAAEITTEFFGSTNLVNSIGDATYIYGLVFVIIFSIVLITFIYQIFMMFSERRHKTGDYDE